MAGEWLKFEKATPDKPEVFAIAGVMGIDPDAVVGKLIRVWSWFDTHTVDGNGRGVTLPLLDRIASAPGFAAAMRDVGWIEFGSAGVTLPNFSRHTGETAKGRALTAKRVADHKAKGNGKGNASGNANTVSTALPREEKKREEKDRATPTPYGAEVAAMLSAYHATLPLCQRIEVLNPKRKKRIAEVCRLARDVCARQGWNYVPEKFWTAYFTVCSQDAWMRGELPNPKNPTWKQNMDVLIREDRFAGVMDKAIAARGDSAGSSEVRP